MKQNMPPAEVEIDARSVSLLLADQWPGWHGQTVASLGNGWDNFMFRVGDDHVARLPRRQASVELVVAEAHWLPRLAPRLPLPVPTPQFLGRPGRGYPWPWTVCPWIDGVSAALNPTLDVDVAIAEVAGFLLALHRPAPEDSPFNPFRSVPLSDKVETAAERFEHLEARHEVSKLRRAWEEALAVGATALPPRWVHGDLHPHNILVRGGRPAGVIDFSDLAAGDPAVDLAVIWMLFEPDRHDGFWALYDRDEPGLVERSRGWAINQCLVYLSHSGDSPAMEAVGMRTLENLLTEVSGGG